MILKIIGFALNSLIEAGMLIKDIWELKLSFGLCFSLLKAVAVPGIFLKRVIKKFKLNKF